MAINGIAGTTSAPAAPPPAPAAPIDQQLAAQIAQGAAASAAGATSTSAPSDSVQLSAVGLNLSSQLFAADGTLNLTAAASVLQSSINDTLFASLSSPDSAQFSSISMMLAGAGSTQAATGNDVSQLFQLASQSKMVSGMPSNLTAAQFSQFLPTLAAQIPGFSALLNPTASAPASASTDGAIAAVSES